MAHNGIVYLLHFERSYRHARHYIGFTQNLEQRLEEHRAGRGSPLVAAAIADGIDFQLAAIWEGDRHDERRLHRQKNTRARLCPLCVGSELAAVQATVDLVDELLLSVLGGTAQPATLTALQAQLRRRGKRIGSVHGGSSCSRCADGCRRRGCSARSPGRSCRRPPGTNGPRAGGRRRERVPGGRSVPPKIRTLAGAWGSGNVPPPGRATTGKERLR